MRVAKRWLFFLPCLIEPTSVCLPIPPFFDDSQCRKNCRCVSKVGDRYRSFCLSVERVNDWKKRKISDWTGTSMLLSYTVKDIKFISCFSRLNRKLATLPEPSWTSLSLIWLRNSSPPILIEWTLLFVPGSLSHSLLGSSLFNKDKVNSFMNYWTNSGWTIWLYGLFSDLTSFIPFFQGKVACFAPSPAKTIKKFILSTIGVKPCHSFFP